MGELAAGHDGGIWFSESYGDTDLVNGFIWGAKIDRMAT
jgi:hypothetical protein